MNLIYDNNIKRFILENTDKVFTGVTSVMKLVENEFNLEEAASKFVNSPNNKEGWDYDTIIKMWSDKGKITQERGNIFHQIKENEILHNGGFSLKVNNAYNTFDIERLKNLDNGEYVELLIPYIPAWIVGIADKVTIDGKDCFITDYKCIEDLKFETKEYFDTKKKKRVKPKLKAPLNHLDDCKGIKAMLQVSLYAYFLESYGYRFRGGVIEQAIFKNEKYVKSIEHPVTYLKKEAETLIKYFKLKSL